MRTAFVLGRWLALCDICGLRHYNTELKKDWRNLMVCAKDFESRHPQDLIRIRPDSSSVPWTRPESIDLFIDSCYCSLEHMQGIAGRGSAGCMRLGFITPF